MHSCVGTPVIISLKDCDRASLTGFKKDDITEENTERRWRWERDRTLARQHSSRPINSSALGEIYESCEGWGEIMMGYFAERYVEVDCIKIKTERTGRSWGHSKRLVFTAID